MMLKALIELEQYLSNEQMQGTLKSLRSQILSRIQTKPSKQYMSMLLEQNKSKKAIEVVKRQFNNLNNKKYEEAILEGFLGKIAYSGKLIDQNMSKKAQKLMNNKIFMKTALKMFPKLNESEIQYQDQLEFATVGEVNNQSANNQISVIDIESDEGSIISEPSYMMAELNNTLAQDTYTDDNDLGYYLYSFHEDELLSGCAHLTQKYGYPACAVTKSSKIPSKIGIERVSKFDNTISFPDGESPNYPLELNGTVYDCMKIKVVYNRQKTGYQEEWESEIREGDILAGRFRIEGVLGSGVFAKVIKVLDLITNEYSCLKMISSHKDSTSKDFFDQALDQIKLLRFIAANCNPDNHYLIKFKSVFYHREHLFIETDLLKDNLFFAYRKNPGFFSLSTIKIIAKQVLEAVRVLHRLHIIHADLKPQNILLKSYHPVEIKVIDLGNSCFFHDHMGQYVQSRSYRAPEVVLGIEYDSKIDIWSIGCILAQLWTKNVLFYNTSVQGMLARMQGIVGPWPEWMLEKGQLVASFFSKQNLIFFEQANNINILIPKATSLSNRIRTHDQQFSQFLGSLLQLDPFLRPSAEQALNHPFLN